MAMTFRTPENLDISYKFLGGKFSVKDMMYRSIGVIPGIVTGGLIMLLTGNNIWAIIVGLPWVILGFFIGGSKVFGKSVLFITALVWKFKLKKKKIRMTNKRSGGTTSVAKTEGKNK